MNIIPTIRYRDSASAVKFLETAFGFEPVVVNHHADGSVQHAELWYGDGVVLLSARSDPPGPFDTGTTVSYVVVDAVDAHHDRARAAGADIVMPLTDQPYGAREYAARDPEGNIWSFGTYRPRRTG